MKSLSCSNKHCPPSRKGAAGAIIRHGFYTTRWGKRRRYQCQMCGKTFCSTTGTPYHRLQHRRTTFDEVAAFSVEGLNKSAIARVQRIAWNTVDRWLERPPAPCRRFNDRRTTGLAVVELRPTRSARSSGASKTRSGSSLRSRSGLGFGPPRWSADGATTTRWSCFEMFPAECSWIVFL